MQRGGLEYFLPIHRNPERGGGIKQRVEVGQQAARTTRLGAVHAREDGDMLLALAQPHRVNGQTLGRSRDLPQFAGVWMSVSELAKTLQAVARAKEPVALLFIRPIQEIPPPRKISLPLRLHGNHEGRTQLDKGFASSHTRDPNGHRCLVLTTQGHT